MSNRTWRGVAICWLVVLVIPSPASAQDAEPTYLVIDCMKSTSSQYADIETDIWKPMHQEMVNQGKKVSWGFYWVLYGDRSACDYYTVNTVTASQLNSMDGTMRDVFEKVHPGKDFDKMMAETAAAREMGRTELWQMIDVIQPEDFTYVQVNQMSADDESAYVEMEREVYKPVHEAMVEDGTTAGWGLYRLVSPHGSAVGYNFGTADFLHTLGSVEWDSWLRKVHPDRDPDEIGAQLDDARDFLKGDVWLLMDRTAPAE